MNAGLWLRVATPCLGVVAALGLGELALRLARPPQLSRIRYPCIYRPDPLTGFRYRPGARGVVAGHFEIENEVVTNSLGFYDDEPLPDDRVGARILAVGDSFTAAMNVPVPQVWTSVLEGTLRARGWAGADVVNLGLDGTGTDVHVALLREYVPRFRPHIIVLAFFANDVGDVLTGRFERECYRDTVLSYQTAEQRDALRAVVDRHRARPVRRWLFEHLYLARLAGAALLPPDNPYRMQFLQPRRGELGLSEETRAAGRARLARALRELEAIAAGCGCRLLVAPVPPRSRANGSREAWQGIAGSRSIERIDVAAEMERLRRAEGLAHEDLYFEHDSHFDATGNALYARVVADALTIGPDPSLAGSL